jgi:hypothetical protein
MALRPPRFALLASLLLAASIARAEPESAIEVEGFHLTTSVGTEFPIDLAVRATLDLPLRLQLSTSLGYLPRSYAAILNDGLVAADVYDETTAALIEAALSNSIIWRTQAGWRPFAAWGFYFQAGYTLITLGGELTGSEAITAATGRTPPLIAGATPRVDVQATSTLHQFGLELGHRWLVLDRLSIQLALGGFATLGATTSMESRTANPIVAKVMEPLLLEGASYLDDTYRSYVHAGYLSLQVGYRFF